MRSRQAGKRGGDDVLVTWTTGLESQPQDDERLLAMNSALEVLERVSPHAHRLVDMRCFAGLSISAIAQLRGVSARTIEREWEKARAFLHHGLGLLHQLREVLR